MAFNDECDLEANFCDGLIFHKVDSADIIICDKKKPKFIGNRYLVGDVLGEGAYGKVKEVLDIETLSRLAVKIMKRRTLKKIPNGEANAQREIVLLRKLSHRNVVGIKDVVISEEKQKIYLIMEYCVCVLQDLLLSTPEAKLPIWQAHKYFSQLLSGLEYLHSNGVVHKDIKPGNLLLATNEVLKISDFGVAEQLDRFSIDDTCYISQGSPAFQPPEIASGDNINFSGFKVDIWCSGVTLYNITTSKYPFEGDNIYKLFENIVKLPVIIPDDVSPRLHQLLSGMLEKDPKVRLSLQEVKHQPWVVQKHCRSPEYVQIPTTKEDLTKSLTVMPLLEELHSQEMPCTEAEVEQTHGEQVHRDLESRSTKNGVKSNGQLVSEAPANTSKQKRGICKQM